MDVSRGWNPAPPTGWPERLTEYELEYIKVFGEQPSRGRDTDAFPVVLRPRPRSRRGRVLVPSVVIVAVLLSMTLVWLGYHHVQNASDYVHKVDQIENGHVL